MRHIDFTQYPEKLFVFNQAGEVAKLFSDAGLICIASLISPYRNDRDACRAMSSDSTFIEVKPTLQLSTGMRCEFQIVVNFQLNLSQVFMNIPLEVCEKRDAKGLYKLARAGKIKGQVPNMPCAKG